MPAGDRIADPLAARDDRRRRPQPGALAWVERVRYPLRSPSPTSTSGASSAPATPASRWPTGDLVALIDDDAEAEPTGSRTSSPASPTPRSSASAASCCPAGPAPSHAGSRTSSTGCSAAATRACPTELAPVRNPIGANMAVRREAISGDRRLSRRGVPPREIRYRGSRHRRRARARGHRARHPDQPALAADELALPAARNRVPHRDAEQATLGYLTRRSFEEGMGKATLARLVGSQQGLELGAAPPPGDVPAAC